MADRTSAALFGLMFDELAKHCEESWVVDLAQSLWDETWKYDFNQYQMYCDDSLIKLGFASRDKSGVVYRRYKK